MDDAGTKIRAVSDHLLLLAEQLVALEEQKRQLAPDHERFVDLGVAVRDLGQEIARVTEEEERIGVLASGERNVMPTAAQPVTSRLAELHDLWREARRRLDVAEPGTAEAGALQREAAEIRAEYSAAVARLLRTNRG
jgi:hypothetical protein